MQHVLLDLYGCPAALLADEAIIRHCLEELPSVIGMQQASPVFLEHIQTSSPADDGLSGFVILATSHCSLHAWPSYGMVNLDVFSCLPFDVDTVVLFIAARLEAPTYDIRVVERATRSPRPVTLARRGVRTP